MGYRGEIIYLKVYCKLIEIVENSETINYRKIGDMMGLPPGQNMGKQVGIICDEINQDEHINRRPMLSAVVIRKDWGMPGDGFFKCANNLGKFKGGTDEEKYSFWKNELKSVYKIWSRII